MPDRYFPAPFSSQDSLDSARKTFENQLLYRGLLYNPETRVYMMAVSVNKQIHELCWQNSCGSNIVNAGNQFGSAHQLTMHYSGLPLIRTNMATKVATEMKWFSLGIRSAFCADPVDFFQKPEQYGFVADRGDHRRCVQSGHHASCLVIRSPCLMR